LIHFQQVIMQSGSSQKVDTKLIADVFYDLDSTKLVLASAGLFLPPDSVLKSKRYRYQLISGQKRLLKNTQISTNYVVRNFEGFGTQS
jgi:hypothetical protein